MAATKQNVRVGTFMTFLIQTRHCDLRNAIQIIILIANICVRNKSRFPSGSEWQQKKPDRLCQNVRDASKITYVFLTLENAISAKIAKTL